MILHYINSYADALLEHNFMIILSTSIWIKAEWQIERFSVKEKNLYSCRCITAVQTQYTDYI